MRGSLSLWALPTPLLLLIASAPVPAVSHEPQWPYNLPPHVKYFPKDEALVKRELSLQQKLQQQPAIGVRKMSSDPEQKFYLDYWSFDVNMEDHNFDSWTNTSTLHKFEPCTPLHSNHTFPNAPRRTAFSFWNRSPFDKRDFQCPSGTNPCTSIGYPNSCCPTGETCQIVQDTGLGSVGCCPAGSTCAGLLSSCAAGQIACPNNPGGGCCIAGYACLDVGCVYTGTATVLVTPTPPPTSEASTTTLTITTVYTPAVSPASPTTVTSTSTYVPITPVVSTSEYSISTTTSSISTARTKSTSTSVPTSSTTIVTSTSHTTISNSETCSPGFKSCPVSLGGGCCSTDRACGSDVCPAQSSTDAPDAPVRPTTDAMTTTAAASTITGNGCPTGFYACSAYYQGGCCQVGRNCAKTNCPASASTTLVSGSGITIVAPNGNGISTANLATGTCAGGWQTCAASNGGGCCPSGFACGTSCTATASGAAGLVTGKEAPQSGAVSMYGSCVEWLAFLGVLISVLLPVL